MKAFVMVVVSLLSLNAVAAPSQYAIEQKALEILLKNSGQLTSQDGQSVAEILSTVITTGPGTLNKVKNSCVFDKGDSLFKCTLNISNSDAPGQGGSESSIEIKYQLEEARTGLPSNGLFTFSVSVSEAG